MYKMFLFDVEFEDIPFCSILRYSYLVKYFKSFIFDVESPTFLYLSIDQTICDNIDRVNFQMYVNRQVTDLTIFVCLVDECAIAKDNNHQLCSMKCVNLINSYICECPVGFVLASADNMTCVRGMILVASFNLSIPVILECDFSPI